MNKKILEMAMLNSILSSACPSFYDYFDPLKISSHYTEESLYEPHFVVKNKKGYLSNFDDKGPVFTKDKQMALIFQDYAEAKLFKNNINANKIIKVALNEFKNPRIYE